MRLFHNAADKGYDSLVAENSFISDLQLAIEEAIASRGVSQADLAKSLGVSEARVSQILGGNGSNLQARTISKIASALDMRASIELIDNSRSIEIDCDEEESADCGIDSFSDWVRRACETMEQGNNWKQIVAPNDNWVSVPTSMPGRKARTAVAAPSTTVAA